MDTIINDWTPETKSLLESLEKHGFAIIGGFDGENNFSYETGQAFIDNLSECDESHLYVKHNTSDRQTWIFLVYGNDPGDLPSDWGVLIEGKGEEGKYQTANAALEKAVKEHYDKWELMGQPKRRVK